MEQTQKRLKTSGLLRPETSSRLNTLLSDLLSTQQTNDPKEKAVDLQTAQIDMEKMFHKNQLHSRIKKEFVNSDIDFRTAFTEIGIDHKFGFDLLVQMVLYKRVNLPTLVGILRRHYQGDCQKTADALLTAAKHNLVDWAANIEVFIIRFDIDAEVMNEIEVYQYPLPMIVEPKELRNNRDTGYFTKKDSVILKSNNHHDDDVCLDFLNKINKVKLKVNSDTVAFLKNNWKNLDRPKPGEERSEYQKRVKAFNKYDRTSKDVLTHLETMGGEFYLTHKYDKRGRVYCQGYHVTYQGNDWNKSCIEFAHGELVED
ncbi:RNA polymerase I [Agrobacterium phage OLIVR2]|uniref:RNA polymerase I n=1 Tax=Agrobacterium phage OLIVR1 TaxID=2723769 RepID=A0A858MRL4_9CAUD|nr:RNA polymerase I [Agrobacterium phage OLIVR1]QIW87239.1 RNA polymerase I [Agrobacterium phage OLIVR1]QIW87347.1 RNA polymerase I [Agrobacterium phage OLIVR2]QIW87454.1 RNA polymerase I [Agrobacterium phage OLIVR3]